ncbi:MAG: STAS domain-containing protein [bacterium]
MPFEIKTRDIGPVTILELSGRLDGTPETAVVHETVRALIGKGRKTLVLDMGAVPWANSLGIGTLISSSATARRAGATLVLCSVGERLLKSLQICGIVPDALDVHEDADAAVASLR